MDYKALYRQFRPLTFDHVIGQAAITETLMNQVMFNKVGHAYLFTGSRGTGKTTTSKIMSRVVNCEAPQKGQPCNACPTCLSILKDTHLDVVEMDAASNNGVDDIRDLRESVKFPPSAAKYKVMIIDEVHMLSKGAFNALLKTLEEPPDYMIFILATTEPHKVPATITSRCQRFEFKRIEPQASQAYLRSLCDQLGVTVDDEALKLIIRLAEGAMRDALSLLEQCLSYSGSELTYQQASKVLGRVQDDALTFLSQAIIKGDIGGVLRATKTHYQSGKDVMVLLADLIELFRAGMLVSTTQDFDHLDLAAEHLDWLKSLDKQVVLSDWLTYLDDLIEADKKVRYASHPWIALEIALLKMVIRGSSTDYQALVRRVESLEKQPQTQSNVRSSPSVQVVAEKKHANSTLPIQDKEHVTTNDKPTHQHMDSSHLAGPVDHQTLDGLSLKVIVEGWDNFLLAVKQRLVSTYALLKEVKPVSYQNEKVQLQLNEELKILKVAIENHDNMMHIQEAFKLTYGCLPKIEIIDYVLEDSRESDVRAFLNGVISDDHIVIK